MEPATIAIVASGGCTAAALALAGARKAYKFFRRLGYFLDDLMGAPARPGVPERPGVMARIGSLEEKVEGIHHEVTNNDGSSLKDSVHRQEAALADHIDVSTADKEAAHTEAIRMWAAIEAAAKSYPPPTTMRRAAL